MSELVHGERAGLVGAQDIHVGRVLDGARARDEDAAAPELHRTNGHADREHHGERDRHRAHEQHQGDRQHVYEALPLDKRRHERHHHERADDDEQPPHDPRGHFFDMQLWVRALDELGGATEVRTRPGGHHDPCRLSVAHGRTGVDDGIGRLVDLGRLARQRGLVHAQRAVADLEIGRDEVTGAHADNVAGDELACRHATPALIAQDARRHG